MLRLAFTALLMLSLAGTTQAAGDPTAGEERSITCQGCHGADGNSIAPIWPSLAGQHAGYLIKQLKDFQSGARQNETMAPLSMDLTEQDMADVSAYFSAQQLAPPEGEVDPGQITLGERLYFGGNKRNGIPPCTGCHGPKATGLSAARFPNLAGQKREYLAKQLQDFRAGLRANDMNEMMRMIAGKMTDSEIEAVAAYLANLR